MPDYFISKERAENDLLDCSAFLAERIKSADGHAEAMGEILPRYLAKGDVDLAAELANAVDDPHSRDRLLMRVAEKCAEIDDDEYALQLADSIEDHGLQAQGRERVALVKADKGQTEKAFRIAETLGHPDFVLAGIAVNQAASGDEAAAASTLAGIQFSTARSTALQQIAAAQIENGEMEKAAETLDAAFAAALEIEHNEEQLRALCDIGNMFIPAKRNDRSVQTFDRARSLAEILENVHRDYFLVNCALGFLVAGSSDTAERTLDLVTDKTQMASALLGIARFEWKHDEKADAVDSLEEAYQILKSQRDIETRDSRARNALMATIAIQFAGFGLSERAMEIAQENQDPAEGYGALAEIAQFLAGRGDDELARQAMNAIPEDANRLFALIAMSDAKKNREDIAASIALLDEAAELAETVPQLAARSGVLNGIAARYATYGQTDKARAVTLENLTVIAGIRDESSLAASLAGVADVYGTSGIELTDAEREFLGRFVRKVDW